MSYRLRPQAEDDIEDIALHIAHDNSSAATHWYEKIYRYCQRLGEMPGIGVGKPEIRPDLKSFATGNYLILYRETDEGAEIMRVVHGARQWENLL